MLKEKEILLDEEADIFKSLAKEVISSGLSPLVGTSLKEKIIELEKKKQLEDEKKALIRQKLEKKERIDFALSLAKDKKEGFEKEKDAISLVLGKNLFEKRKDAVLDRRIDQFDDLYERYIKLESSKESAFKRMFYKIEEASFSKDFDKTIIDAVNNIFSLGFEIYLKGNEEDVGKIKLLTDKIDAQRDAIKILTDKIEDVVEAEGESTVSIDLEKAEIAYGSYLFQNGHKWIGEDTPESVLDLISHALSLEEKIEKIEEEEKAEEKRKRDGEIDVLINELISQIDALEDEKKRIDGKISSIRFEIMKLEEEKKA